MAIDFPSTNLIPGTVHTAAGVSWKWDGTTWQASAVGGNNNNVCVMCVLVLVVLTTRGGRIYS